MSSSGLPKPSGLKPPSKISRPCTVTPKPSLPLAATPSARASKYLFVYHVSSSVFRRDISFIVACSTYGMWMCSTYGMWMCDFWQFFVCYNFLCIRRYTSHHFTSMTQCAASTGPTLRLRLPHSAECTLITYSCLWFSLIRLLHEQLFVIIHSV